MSLTDDILMHYGMPRRSGRYPWGSGDNPYQHSGDFLSRVEELKKSNFTFTDKDGKTYTGEVAIAKSMGLSTTQFRTQMSLAKDERRSAIFDEDLMTFAMGNCITLEDTNGNRKLLKKRYEQKIDAVAAMMDAYIAYKLNRDAFE